MRKTTVQKLLSLGSLALLLAFPSALSAGEEMNLDWSFVPASGALQGLYGTQGAPIFLQDIVAGQIVDNTTTPANPFADTPRALYLGVPATNSQVRIRLRPFMAEQANEGWLEIEFQAVNGKFALSLGAIQKPWEPADDWSYIETERAASVRFAVGEPILVGNNIPLKTAGLFTLNPNQPHVFRVAWKLSGEDAGLRFQINGETVVTENGEEFVLPVKSEFFAQGYPGFSITSGSPDTPSAEMFFGRIRAGTPEAKP